MVFAFGPFKNNDPAIPVPGINFRFQDAQGGKLRMYMNLKVYLYKREIIVLFILTLNI
jgi:hypothetical protein